MLTGYQYRFGVVRSAVWGNYAEASDDVHQLLDVTAAEAATNTWRFLGARNPGEAKGFYASKLRSAWGLTAARAFARHRLSRVPFVGYTRETLPARLAQRSVGRANPEWEQLNASLFHAHVDFSVVARHSRTRLPW